MSISERDSQALAERDEALSLGRIRAIEPPEPAIRMLYVTAKLWSEIDALADSDDDSVAERYAQLIAAMERFVWDENLPPNYLKPLQPKSDGLWEIRNRKPKPSIRVFGMFLIKDIFVCTAMSERKPLGEKGSFEWKQITRYARAEWNRLFTVKPIIGDRNDVYSNDDQGYE